MNTASRTNAASSGPLCRSPARIEAWPCGSCRRSSWPATGPVCRWPVNLRGPMTRPAWPGNAVNGVTSLGESIVGRFASDGDHTDVVPAGHRRRPHAGAPRRADRILLPDAGVGVRRRGCRAGDAHPRLAGLRPLRGTFRGAHLALSHRQQRVLRRPARPTAPRPADGDDRVRPGPPTGSSESPLARERVRRAGPRQQSCRRIPATRPRRSPSGSRSVSRSSPPSSTCLRSSAPC